MVRLAGGGFRYESPTISMMCASCRSRSIAALARSGSPNSGGHSSTARFEVMIMEPRWYRRLTISNRSMGSSPTRERSVRFNDSVGSSGQVLPASSCVLAGELR